MRKFLVATTAFASLVAASAFADDAPTVTVGGSYTFEAGSVSQKSAFKGLTNSPNQRKVMFNNFANLFVGAKGTADNGVTYGANVRVTATAQTYNGFMNGKTDRTYLWTESSMGRVEMGSNFAASKTLKVGAESIAKATGGASNGHWISYVNEIAITPATPTVLANSSQFTTSGDNILASYVARGEQPMLVTWMSPRYSGIQLGLSFTPDMGNNGTGNADTTTAARQKNIISAGLNYTNEFDDVNISLSASYDRAQKVTSNPLTGTVYQTGNSSLINPLKSYALGAAVGKGEFSVAASYGNDGKSGYVKNVSGVTGIKNHFWTAGTAYENGPFAGSITYFNSKKGKTLNSVGNYNKVTAYSLGLDYQVAAGFKPYVEVTRFTTKYGAPVATTPNAVATNRNKGYVVLLGSSVSF